MERTAWLKLAETRKGGLIIFQPKHYITILFLVFLQTCIPFLHVFYRITWSVATLFNTMYSRDSELHLLNCSGLQNQKYIKQFTVALTDHWRGRLLINNELICYLSYDSKCMSHMDYFYGAFCMLIEAWKHQSTLIWKRDHYWYFLIVCFTEERMAHVFGTTQ